MLLGLNANKKISEQKAVCQPEVWVDNVKIDLRERGWDGMG
jgi:hypothetical protein